MEMDWQQVSQDAERNEKLLEESWQEDKISWTWGLTVRIDILEERADIFKDF